MDNNLTSEGGKRCLYEDVALRIKAMIAEGGFRPGDRIPSVRLMSQQMRVSVNTVSAAYAHLEDLQLIEVRPQSGHYVRPAGPAPLAERPVRPDDKMCYSKPVTLEMSAMRLIRDLMDPALASRVVSLNGASPDLALLPTLRLNGLLATETKRRPLESVSYGSAQGSLRLRCEISKRLFGAGCVVSPDEIVVTSGCLEAVVMALVAVCRPGDIVAVASPVYFLYLYAIQGLGLKVLEIPTSPSLGMNIEVLRYAIRQNPVRAVIIISNFCNPTGCLMPNENKRQLVELLAQADIPLIEDDVHGELGFAAERPKSVKAYDQSGLVLQCGSFSKTLAPGYRIGWIVAGRFQQKVEAMKGLLNIATASPTQMAIAQYLAAGGYDRHLRTLRRTYSTRMAQMRVAIGKHFPPTTRVSDPAGGTLLWVEMPDHVDALALYSKAMALGIAFAPGPLFTVGNSFRNCLRLNASVWSPRIEEAIQTVGTLACKLTELPPHAVSARTSTSL